MSTYSSVRRLACGAFCLVFLLALIPEADAFYLFGGSTTIGSGVRFIKWDISDMDHNNDGDVNGPNDGIEFTFEGGPHGWTLDEMDVLRQAFQVWQDVPTSYMAFTFTDPIPDPLELEGGFGSGAFIMDRINLISVEFPDDPVQLGLGPGVLGTTMIDYAIENTYVQSRDGTFLFPVTGGRIYEVDITLNGSMFRSSSPEQPAAYDILGTMVHEIGHAIGLAHTPTHNLEINPEILELVEEPVLAMRDATGQLRLAGVTPTMFPMYFEVAEGQDTFADGSSDLAPSDIAAVSFQYPRGSQDGFFQVAQEARTFERPSFPSYPMLGCLITAWCDADNNPATPRVPIESTITGLYENVTQTQSVGKFLNNGLFKQFETSDGVQFQASYTFTASQIPGQDPVLLGYDSPAFDSTHASELGAPVWTVGYETLFPSEVFREGGNVFGMDNYDQGTPLTFDPLRRKVVSANSGKTLDQMLPGIFPMFGEPSFVCPMNIVYGGIKSDNVPTALRSLRDNILLGSAFGTAFVDAYYGVAPALAEFLFRHPCILTGARAAAAGGEWTVRHYLGVLVLAACILLLRVRSTRRFKTAAIAAILILLAAAASLIPSPADALILYMTTPEMVQVSDVVVQGEVTGVDSHYDVRSGLRRGIITDVSIRVTDTMKGRSNKNATISMTLPGGRVGGIVSFSPDLPKFIVGQEVVLFLEDRPNVGYLLVGGRYGKKDIRTFAELGAKYVAKNDLPLPDPSRKSSVEPVQTKPAPQTKEEAQKQAQEQAQSNWVPLEEYVDQIRSIVREQEKADGRQGPVGPPSRG